MKTSIFFFLLFVLIFAILNCEKTATKSGNPPSPVMIFHAQADTIVIEKGIDAVPDGDKIRIEWSSSKEEEVSVYNLYRSNDKNKKFSLISTNADTSFEDENINFYERYYYYVIAKTDEGVLSNSSDTVDYKLLKKADHLIPDGITPDPVPEFIWEDMNQPPLAHYIIRIVDVESNNTVWISVISSSYCNLERVIFNSDSSASIDSLVVDKEYNWRIDILVIDENSGSESNWSSLIYHEE